MCMCDCSHSEMPKKSHIKSVTVVMVVSAAVNQKESEKGMLA